MKKKIEIKQTLLDKVVAYVSPVKGRDRMQARAQMALAGGYQTSRDVNGRRTAGSAFGGNDADGDILPDLPTLREDSRNAVRRHALAAGIINTKVTNVVGTGLIMRPQIDYEFLGMPDADADIWEANTQREWRLWADSTACDMERTCCFFELQDLVFRSALESGDIFSLLPYEKRAGEIYGLKVQLIEGDRVSNPNFKMDTATLAGGIERSASGEPIKAHIQDGHPGSLRRTKSKWDERAFFSDSGRRNLLHIYRKLRAGQSRGVPDLAPVLESLRQLSDFTEAELKAAVVSSLFTVFVTTPGGDGLTGSSSVGGKTSDADIKMGAGSVVDLAEGEGVEFANPSRPNTAFDGFVTAVLRQIGAALELPFELLIKHFTASYSASRGALLEAWKYFDSRRKWLVMRFCQPVYETWLEEAVASGRIVAPGFLNGDLAVRAAYCGTEWIGPARGHIQPLQEVNALREHVELGTKTLEKATAETDGGRWDRNHRQRSKEKKARVADGLEESLMIRPLVDQEPPDKIDKKGNDD